MSGRTARFGFSMFGAGIPGSLTEDGGKYSSIDRAVMDRLLNAFEIHNHAGGTRLSDPDEAPLLSLDSTTGELPAGTTFFYRVSFVDQFGLESAASPEMAITTPTPIQPPGAPFMTAAVMAGGDTNPGVRTGVTYYALTSIKGDDETGLGDSGVITVSSDMRAITVTFPTVPTDVDSFGIWRKGPSEGGFTKIGTATATDGGTFLDDGAVAPVDNPCSPATQPSAINLTNSTNTVTVTAPNADVVSADPSSVKRWRIYRTRTSGVYSSTSMVADVVTTVNEDGTGGLLTTFVDDGSTTPTTGQPLNVSQTLTPSALIAFPMYDTSADLPAASGYADGSLAFVTSPGLAAYLVHDSAWVLAFGLSDSLYFMSEPSGKHYRLGVQDDGTMFTELLLPAKPTSVVAAASTVTSGEIDLEWSELLPAYAKPITHYSIIATPSGGSPLAAVNTTDDARAYAYTGLTAGTTYTFTVTAVSAEGSSDASDASNAVVAPTI